MTRVVHFRDFIEDRRASMEVYADHLAEALKADLPADWQVETYRPQVPQIVRALPIGELHRMRIARYLSYPWQARRRRGDINHVIEHGYGHLTYALPPERTVVTVNDLIPLLRWKGEIRGLAPGRRPWFSEASLRALRRAAALITISENTKRDLVRHIGCDPDRITVIYWGLNRHLRPRAPDDRLRLRAAFGLPGPDIHLVLITGAQFYKNQETSLAVAQRLQQLCRKPVRLVRFGRATREWEDAVSRLGMGDGVIALSPLFHDRLPFSDEQISDLYNAVDCVLFPSWYEGFGMPPLEAMACGTPAVTSNVASLPEVAADAAPMAAPDDVEGLAQAVHAMLEDPERRRISVESGLRHAAKFSWERNAGETMRVYEKMLAKLADEGSVSRRHVRSGNT